MPPYTMRNKCIHASVHIFLRRFMAKNAAKEKEKDKEDFFLFLPNRLRTFSKPSSEIGPLGVSDALHAL